MSRLAHFAVAMAVLLGALAMPCQALLTSPQLSPHKCCTGRHGMPAKSGCQSQCASSANPGVLPGVAIPAPALAASQTFEAIMGPVVVCDLPVTAPIALSPPGNLYLRNSSLLI